MTGNQTSEIIGINKMAKITKKQTIYIIKCIHCGAELDIAHHYIESAERSEDGYRNVRCSECDFRNYVEE
jgi:DNA-directed RNA polymerase subunit RPC12/RpoP